MPNETWQSDVTHYRLTTGTEVEILTWLDDHSRYALSVTAHHPSPPPIVVTSFRHTAATHGIPASILTDNGMVYTTRFAGGKGGRSAFETLLADLAVTQKNARPNHPTTCGKVERFQQTLKNWLHARTDPAHAPSKPCRHNSTPSTTTYNHHRPHRSLAHAPPPPRSTPPTPKPPRPATANTTPTTASAPTPSTTPASSPSATTDASTTSASAEPTPDRRVLLLVQRPRHPHHRRQHRRAPPPPHPRPHPRLPTHRRAKRTQTQNETDRTIGSVCFRSLERSQWWAAQCLTSRHRKPISQDIGNAYDRMSRDIGNEMFDVPRLEAQLESAESLADVAVQADIQRVGAISRSSGDGLVAG